VLFGWFLLCVIFSGGEAFTKHQPTSFSVIFRQYIVVCNFQRLIPKITTVCPVILIVNDLPFFLDCYVLTGDSVMGAVPEAELRKQIEIWHAPCYLCQMTSLALSRMPGIFKKTAFQHRTGYCRLL
jgi:hypothetical protein